jgi:hypothetical protein
MMARAAFSSGSILAVLCQSEALTWFSVVFPLNAQVIYFVLFVVFCLALRSNEPLSAFSVILTRFFVSRDFGN